MSCYLDLVIDIIDPKFEGSDQTRQIKKKKKSHQSNKLQHPIKILKGRGGEHTDISNYYTLEEFFLYRTTVD